MTRRARRDLPFVALAMCLVGAAGSAAPSGPASISLYAASNLLNHADADGLDAAAYRSGGPAALAAYAHDLALGRAGLRTLDSDVALPATQFDPQTVVADTLRQEKLRELPDRLAPPYPDYARLKAALARYRAIAAAGGWSTLKGIAKDYAAPDEASLLRRRLSFEDTALAADPSADLAVALKRYQLRHGLDADGVLGRATLAELNVSASARADTILANMERWRWMPRTLEADRIVINAAAAELTLTLGGRTMLASRVIVGRPHDPTPILRAEAAGLTVNPPWNVPTTIAAREILPKLKRNPAYLANQDMVLLNGPPGDPQGLSVNWRAIPAGTFPYRIRQHPGPANPLGQVKLELPNRFDVYLHDTPGRTAFARADRHLSHGCVRVEQILPLASYALSADLASVEKIVTAINAGETAYMPLHRNLPVYFLYWTAFSDENGNISFRDDIYGRDARLLKALHAPVLMADISQGCRKA